MSTTSSWSVITRNRGDASGRSLFTSEISRESAEQWLAANPQPADAETLVVDDDAERVFAAPYCEESLLERAPEPEVHHLLELAKRGKDLELPAVERQARNIVIAILEHARDLDDDAVYALADLARLVQDSEAARARIWEAI